MPGRFKNQSAVLRAVERTKPSIVGDVNWNSLPDWNRQTDRRNCHILNSSKKFAMISHQDTEVLIGPIGEAVLRHLFCDTRPHTTDNGWNTKMPTGSSQSPARFNDWQRWISHLCTSISYLINWILSSSPKNCSQKPFRCSPDSLRNGSYLRFARLIPSAPSLQVVAPWQPRRPWICLSPLEAEPPWPDLARIFLRLKHLTFASMNTFVPSPKCQSNSGRLWNLPFLNRCMFAINLRLQLNMVKTLTGRNVTSNWCTFQHFFQFHPCKLPEIQETHSCGLPSSIQNAQELSP